MKKNIHFIIIMIIITSCSSDFLNIYPETTLNEGNFYQSETEYLLLVNGCYVSLRNFEKSNHVSISELASDNLAIQNCASAGEANRGVIDNFLVSSNNQEYADAWSTLYTGISRCNKLLYEIDRSTIQWSAGIKERSTGEGLFLRALYYFHLVRLYGGVPQVTTPITAQEAMKIKRAPESDIYSLILDDLQKSIAQLSMATNREENGRSHAMAAIALLGRVQLTLKNYTDAIHSFKTVIDAGKYILLPDYSALFDPTNKDFKETLFSVQYSESTSDLSQQYIFLHAPVTSGGNVTKRANVAINVAGHFRPTQDLIDAFEDEDKRKEVSIGFWNGPDWDNTVYDIPYCAKFKPPVSAPDNRCGDNLPIIRFADVLLSYAEALNEVGRTQEAAPYVEMVRNRAGLNHSLAAYNQENLRLLIEKERQVELCFENHRWYDLKRTGRAMEVLRAHGIREKASKTFIPANAFQMETFKLIAPIPAEQILINELEQNPNY